MALAQAVSDFIASPPGAKVAGWAPHCFLVEGAIVLCSTRTAPFESPIRVDLPDESSPVKFNEHYAMTMASLANDTDTWAWTFTNAHTLLKATDEALSRLTSEE
jgi:hypothetical protein